MTREEAKTVGVAAIFSVEVNKFINPSNSGYSFIQDVILIRRSAQLVNTP